MADIFLQALEARRLKREAERMELNKRLAQLNSDMEQDGVAKKVYLATLEERAKSAPPPKPDAVEAAPQPPQGALVQPPLMVKEMILAIIKDAYPMGLTASQIKGKAFLRYKHHVNPNTLTVTLGRFSKPKEGEEKLARCDGRIWFYVPPSAEAKPRLLDLYNGSKHAAE